MRPPTRKASPLTSSSSTDDRVLVGRVTRAHGLRGAVVIETHTDDPVHRFAPGAEVSLADGTALTVARYEATDRSPVVTFITVDDRAGAEALAGERLYIEPAARRPLGENEFWPDELVGLEVVDEAGAHIGRVSEVETGQSQDRLVIAAGDAQFQVPLVRALVPVVDVDTGRVVVVLPPGLGPATA